MQGRDGIGVNLRIVPIVEWFIRPFQLVLPFLPILFSPALEAAE
jgi:hypothetical protein